MVEAAYGNLLAGSGVCTWLATRNPDAPHEEGFQLRRKSTLLQPMRELDGGRRAQSGSFGHFIKICGGGEFVALIYWYLWPGALSTSVTRRSKILVSYMFVAGGEGKWENLRESCAE